MHTNYMNNIASVCNEADTTISANHFSITASLDDDEQQSRTACDTAILDGTLDTTHVSDSRNSNDPVTVVDDDDENNTFA